MRLAKLLAFGFAALAVGVAIPAPAQSDDLKDVGLTTTTALANVEVVSSPVCSPGCGKGHSRFPCCKPKGPIHDGETDGDTDVSLTEAAATVERDELDPFQVHTCTRKCPPTARCTFCGRGQVQCCVHSWQPEQVDSPTTKAAVTDMSDNAIMAKPPWDCPKGFYYGNCGWNGRRMLKCCIKGQPPNEVEEVDATTNEVIAAVEDDTGMRRCTTDDCVAQRQNHGFEPVNHISARDNAEAKHGSTISVNGGDHRVDQSFCRWPASCRRGQECWMRLVRNYPQYYCKNVRLGLDTSPAATINDISTRNELSALDNEIHMDLCLVNGLTCTDVQVCWYDSQRPEQPHCKDKPTAEVHSSVASPTTELSTRANLMPSNRLVGSENCTPRCNERELCYFNTKSLEEPQYLCDSYPTSSFIEAVPVVELDARDGVHISEEVDPSFCNPRCPANQVCDRMIFSGVVIYYCV